MMWAITDEWSGLTSPKAIKQKKASKWNLFLRCKTKESDIKKQTKQINYVMCHPCDNMEFELTDSSATIAEEQWSVPRLKLNSIDVNGLRTTGKGPGHDIITAVENLTIWMSLNNQPIKHKKYFRQIMTRRGYSEFLDNNDLSFPENGGSTGKMCMHVLDWLNNSVTCRDSAGWWKGFGRIKTQRSVSRWHLKVLQ